MFATMIILLVASGGILQDEIPKLRKIDEPPQEKAENVVRQVTNFYRGDELRMKQVVHMDGDGNRNIFVQDFWLNGKPVYTVGKTELYHAKNFFHQETDIDFSEFDLDFDNSWDLLVVESNARYVEAFQIAADGFLTPVSSSLLNEANAHRKEDNEWLHKQIVNDLKKHDEKSHNKAVNRSTQSRGN